MNNYFKLAFIGFISIAGLYMAFKGEDLTELIFHLSRVDIFEVSFACFLLVSSCVIRAYRWQLLLNPFDKIQLKTVFGATMIGYFGNGIFAFRLGELLKAYSVAKKTRITTMQAFGTVIIERLLDIIAVVGIFIILLPWFPFEDDYIKYASFGFTVIAFAIIFILYISLRYRLIQNFEKVKWFSSGFGLKIFHAMSRLFEGLETLMRNDDSWKIIITSILLWGIYYFETIILISACGLNLELLEIGILLVLGSIAFGIPALPGSAGTYDAGIKYSLVIVFNITSAKALNYAIISHSVAYFPLLAIGFIYFLIGNIELHEVKKIEINK